MIGNPLLASLQHRIGMYIRQPTQPNEHSYVTSCVLLYYIFSLSPPAKIIQAKVYKVTSLSKLLLAKKQLPQEFLYAMIVHICKRKGNRQSLQQPYCP